MIAGFKDSAAMSECGFGLAVADTIVGNKKTLGERVKRLRFIKLMSSGVFKLVVEAFFERLALRKVLIRVGVVL